MYYLHDGQTRAAFPPSIFLAFHIHCFPSLSCILSRELLSILDVPSGFGKPNVLAAWLTTAMGLAISRLLYDVARSTLGVTLLIFFVSNIPYKSQPIEIARGAKMLIRMQGNQTILDPPETGSVQDTKRATERKTMNFSFDKSYWSAGSRDEPSYCSQQTLFDDLGKELLDHGFAGFNACILACRFL
jgi:hypothetical protein